MCCSVVPFSNDRWERNKKNIITKPENILPGYGPSEVTDESGTYIIEGDVIPVTKTGKCPFLNKNLLCNIYEDRPEICRRFGTETHLMMKCNFQDKDGKARSRQENRSILRQQEKWTNNLMNRFSIWK